MGGKNVQCDCGVLLNFVPSSFEFVLKTLCPLAKQYYCIKKRKYYKIIVPSIFIFFHLLVPLGDLFDKNYPHDQEFCEGKTFPQADFSSG